VVVSAVVFREGDVVEYAGYHSSPGRVSHVTRLVWVDFDGSTGGYRAESLRLLRRPVRMGDALVSSSGDVVEASCGVPYFKYGFTHVDGTPIDPPQAKASEFINPPEVPLRHAENVQPPARKRQCNGCSTWRPPHDLIETFDGAEAYCPMCITEAPAVLLPEHHLARAIFETDARVVAFVDRASEVKYTDATGSTRPEYDKPLRRAFDHIWRRDLNGWRTEAEARAVQILDALRGKP
jgi:hypothetical protein